MWLLKRLNLSVPKENIVLIPITWTVVPAMLCISFHAKHVQNNTQVVLKIFDLDLTITSQPIGISLKRILSNKCHFTLTLGITNIMVWVIGKLPSFIKQSVDDLRRRESFWQYELDTFQPNGLNERDVVLLMCLFTYIVFIFSGLTHYIYCSTLISTIILRVIIILLFTLIVIIINIVSIITITILFHLFISFKIYLFIYYLFIDTWTYSARRESFW